MENNLEHVPVSVDIINKIGVIFRERGFKAYKNFVPRDPDGRSGEDNSEGEAEGRAEEAEEGGADANYPQASPQDDGIDLAAKLDAYDEAIYQAIAYQQQPTPAPIERSHPLHTAIRELEKFCFKKPSPRPGHQVYFLHHPSRLAWFDLVKVSRGVRPGDPMWRAGRLAEYLGRQRDAVAAGMNQ